MRVYQFRSTKMISILVMGLYHERAAAQCSGVVSNPNEASLCASSAIPDPKVATIDRNHQYSLAELIDVGERNNPKTRTTWERAKQQAKLLGIERSEYFPVLAATVLFGDQRVVQPFPKPLSPVGYSVVDLRLIQPQIELQYLLFDLTPNRHIARPIQRFEEVCHHSCMFPTQTAWVAIQIRREVWAAQFSQT